MKYVRRPSKPTAKKYGFSIDIHIDDGSFGMSKEACKQAARKMAEEVDRRIVEAVERQLAKVEEE